MVAPSAATASGAQAPLIRAVGLSKTFQTESGAIAALKDVSLDIPDGSFTVIYGPSGSGKSTLLNCLIGLDAPTNGRVTYEDNDLYALSVGDRAFFRAHTMGMVYQTSYWVQSLSVLENVALPLHFLGFSEEDARKGAMDSLTRLHLERYAQSSPALLSGGEQQRVAMARALVNNPSYIVADEPTGNLDRTNGDAVIELLRYFNSSLQRTVVLVTHNLDYLAVADQLIYVEDGRVSRVAGVDIPRFARGLSQNVEQSLDRWRRT